MRMDIAVERFPTCMWAMYADDIAGRFKKCTNYQVRREMPKVANLFIKLVRKVLKVPILLTENGTK
ncbi:MAG: hypothetical protein ACKPKO_45705, partial [Candidatus Fonsibacter sp.]